LDESPSTVDQLPSEGPERCRDRRAQARSGRDQEKSGVLKLSVNKLRREIEDLKDGENEEHGLFAGDIHFIYADEDNSDLNPRQKDTVIEFTTVGDGNE